MRDPEVGAPESSMRTAQKVCVNGKFFFVGSTKHYVSGVTYGPFCPDPETGCEYHSPTVVADDFALMARNGINTIRVYTVPPLWLLDAAVRAGLRVMVGIPWEQHVTFLDDRRCRRSIEKTVRDAVRQCERHPAILCYAVGNEIPAPIVRWYGPKRVARFLDRLCKMIRREDPAALVTYVNYPTTEYLSVPSVDLVCFNVYLEDGEQFSAYLARLQNLAGDKPLLMAEIGLDSSHHGPLQQADLLGSEVRTAFSAGCAGVFVFAWTDEWYRGGQEIEDWDFGITTRTREPKPALAELRDTFQHVPFHSAEDWPFISVVVCTRNGAKRLPQCLAALQALAYPNYDVLVINDGSTDDTADCASGFNCRLITIDAGGLSAARNVGLHESTGEIVAYIDDDAYPDPDWLHHLARAFGTADYAAVGGPNIPPDGQGLMADCVSDAPGGPNHVLISDTEAEHVPGCNMAFRRGKLAEIGGFDERFHAAGDDVDVCWRIQAAGGRIGFCPAAVVWHTRRNSIKAYLRQQYGYGKAEALLEAKWPERYNSMGHVSWTGRVYGPHHAFAFSQRGRIYHGTWGLAPFQFLYESTPGLVPSLLLMPEWHLVVLFLAGLGLLGIFWSPLLLGLPLLLLAILAPLVHAIFEATRACKATHRSREAFGKHLALTAVLYVVQPMARLLGRVRHGLVPYRARRRYAPRHASWFKPMAAWCEQWQATDVRLAALECALKSRGVIVMRGSDYHDWDIEARGGGFGGGHLTMAIEEHGGGQQYVRARVRPYFSKCTKAPLWVFGVLTGSALVAGAALPFIVFAAGGLFVIVSAVGDVHCAMGSLATAFRDSSRDEV